MARNNPKRKGSGKKKYTILVDGETEIWYFQMMKQHETLPVDIKPDLPAKKKLKDQYEEVLEYARHSDKVIWMLDFDTLIKEESETKAKGKSKIQEFKGYVSKLKKFDNVVVLVNTPCLEYWYLLHFTETGKYFTNCESVVKELKKQDCLNDYKKTEKYYKKKDNDIYKRLKEFQKDAILRAERLGSFDFENTKTAKAEIYKVFELFDL
jgi:hypothetical protein